MGGWHRAVEVVGLSVDRWRGRRTLLTGVTGFKGGWLALWLRNLGADVVGYSLPPPTTPSLFERACVGEDVRWIDGDVRDLAHLRRVVADAGAEVVFHLAAQPLVRASYDAPVETFDTNVMGTVNVLEALRDDRSVRAVVVVTSDKCYENREWVWPYREHDPLGGHDPYSSSKACAEIATRAYYRSFLRARHVGVATVRAGNVIGGGDWARDRLVPDIVAAISEGSSALVRNPASLRPWQHVLEPLHGYLMLAEKLVDGAELSEGWNFGPSPDAIRPVSELAATLCSLWGDGARWHPGEVVQPHEARLLALDSSKARAEIGWRPRLTLDQALEWTVRWYKGWRSGADMHALSLEQIRRYQEMAP